MFKHRLEALHRSGCAPRLFLQNELLALKRLDARLQRRDHARIARLDRPVDQSGDLVLKRPGLVPQGRGGGFGALELAVPAIAEHGGGGVDEPRCGLEPGQQRTELAFDPLAADGFAIGRAVPVSAEVIGVLAALALAPPSGELPGALAARHGPAQRKVRRDILAGGRIGGLAHALEDALMRLKGDQALVMALAQTHPQRFRMDVSGIDRLGDKPLHGLMPHRACGRVLWIEGLAFEKAPDFGLGGEASAGIAFQRVLHDGGQRFVTHQLLASALGFHIAIADRCAEHPKALFDPCLHLLADLAGVLLTLKLALRSEHGLNELALRRVLESEVEAFDAGVAQLQLAAQPKVEFGIAGEALEIVEDHRVGRAALRIEIGQQRHHPGPLEEIPATRYVIGENGIHLIALLLGKLAAPVLLALKTRRLGGLLLAGHTTIDERIS